MSYHRSPEGSFRKKERRRKSRVEELHKKLSHAYSQYLGAVSAFSHGEATEEEVMKLRRRLNVLRHSLGLCPID